MVKTSIIWQYISNPYKYGETSQGIAGTAAPRLILDDHNCMDGPGPGHWDGLCSVWPCRL